MDSGSSSSCTSSEQPKANLEFAHSRAVTAEFCLKEYLRIAL